MKDLVPIVHYQRVAPIAEIWQQQEPSKTSKPTQYMLQPIQANEEIASRYHQRKQSQIIPKKFSI